MTRPDSTRASVVDSCYVNSCDLFRKNVDKTSFGDSSLKGHLAAFETDVRVASASCLLALVAFTGGLTLT